MEFKFLTRSKDSFPKSEKTDKQDWAQLRHARDNTFGYPINQFLQPSPIFFTQDGHNLWIGDLYKGFSCFLILGGPSFGELMAQKFFFRNKEYTTKELLDYPGHCTMGVNNSIKTFRSNLWVSVDHPQRFIKSIFLDPKIQKIIPLCHTNKKIFDNEKWEVSDITPSICPNVIYYRRNNHFNADQFLWEDTVNWGCHKDLGGKRSVMLAAIRILYQLGFRKVYLLGCDLDMSENKKYHFDQDRTGNSINSNKQTYDALKSRFAELQPIFEKNNFNIYNCNKESKLKAFPYKSFIDCITESTQYIPDIITEKTAGLYDRKIDDKK